MPFEIEQKLVVAIASSALFDLGEADRVFRQQGEDAYRRYQREHEVEVLERGVAFPFIKRLLSFNRSPDDSRSRSFFCPGTTRTRVCACSIPRGVRPGHHACRVSQRQPALLVHPRLQRQSFSLSERA